MIISRRICACRSRFRRVIVSIGVSFVIVLGGCGVNAENISMDNTVTLDAANQAVDRYVDSVVHALSPSAAIDAGDSLALVQPDMPCTEASSDYAQSRRFAQRSYPLVGIKPDTVSAFAAFRSWAQANGFSVNATDEHAPQVPALRAENKDRYGATLEFNFGSLILSVSSPCVWRNGTPEEAPQ